MPLRSGLAMSPLRQLQALQALFAKSSFRLPSSPFRATEAENPQIEKNVPSTADDGKECSSGDNGSAHHHRRHSSSSRIAGSRKSGVHPLDCAEEESPLAGRCSELSTAGSSSTVVKGSESPLAPRSSTGLARPNFDEESEEPEQTTRWLRPKATAGPPIIPAEVLAWAKAPPPKKSGKRKRARTWQDARIKLQKLDLLRQQSAILPAGTRIHLFGRECDAIVRAYDPIGKRYCLRTLDGKDSFEILHGSGHVKWDLIEEVLAPHDAALVHSADSSDDRIGRAMPVPADEDCPVCTDPLDPNDMTNPVGIMACCGNRVHKSCASRWRTSNNNLNVPGTVGLKHKAPDTRSCMFCRNSEITRCCSMRRMFSGDTLPCQF